MTDSRNGQTYKTVTIGTQTWMAENLNYETANSYCYNDNSANCTKYGRLYTWVAAMETQDDDACSFAAISLLMAQCSTLIAQNDV